MTCTRCQSTGFLNIEQLPDDVLAEFEAKGDHDVVVRWLRSTAGHDVAICDCCGDGTGWYGVPGLHFSGDDNSGPGGPYKYNGGMPECS